MNPERVQLFRIRYVIGRNETRTGFENNMLSHTRGRLVPRQPRAFKNITATQLLHEKHLITRHNTHCHHIITNNPQNNLYLIILQSLLNCRVTYINSPCDLSQKARQTMPNCNAR